MEGRQTEFSGVLSQTDARHYADCSSSSFTIGAQCSTRRTLTDSESHGSPWCLLAPICLCPEESNDGREYFIKANKGFNYSLLIDTAICCPFLALAHFIKALHCSLPAPETKTAALRPISDLAERPGPHSATLILFLVHFASLLVATTLCLLSSTSVSGTTSCCINNKTDYHNMSKRIRLTQNIELVRKYIKKILFQFKCIPLLY